ncbi:hypothetical protein EST38_g14695 [Candolleomyces aberdarensis]|uniref:Uncharacterized protein n=1 Tax=Candolleomyces aberdarensis TaxID=2316362 RepID=A0A4Q2CWL5_9AGAR|nr:hypothetical protein EST38_g14695 [Candolleomyces aberdarensis]
MQTYLADRRHWCEMQRENVDVVLWTGGRVACRVPWPTKSNGEKHLQPNQPPLAVFTTLPKGTIIVHCGQNPSCGFELNLTEIRDRTDLVDDFSHFKPGQTLAQYLTAMEETDWYRLEIEGILADEASYYGWCGEFDAMRRQPANNAWP